MDLFECERRAKDEGGSTTATFDLCGPGGVRRCRWIDAYFGLFEIIGVKGFLMVNDVHKQMPYLTCENFNAEGDGE